MKKTTIEEKGRRRRKTKVPWDFRFVESVATQRLKILNSRIPPRCE
jgi:hypothetical protein